jgi:hypothetical protein
MSALSLTAAIACLMPPGAHLFSNRPPHRPFVGMSTLGQRAARARIVHMTRRFAFTVLGLI